MKLSMKWLTDFVKVDVGLRDFSEAMSMSGTKVEGYESTGAEIRRVVVGKVQSVEKHPNADKLVVCMIDVGEGKPIQILTGAKNVVPGALVPVALDGSTLPGGVEIHKNVMRGLESDGMLCSLKELGLTLNDFPYAIEDGIFILEEDGYPGQDIHEAVGLEDAVVDFEITSNRPDCLSVIGLAREVAATFHQPLRLHTPQVKGVEGETSAYVTAAIDEPALCSRYSARAVRNVKIAPSPRWMRERLRAEGVRPINNIVDITNYVCLEYGQPMHAFDYRFIAGGTIHARRARPGESIVTLDGVKRALDDTMLVIADRDKPVAVAGVMGGEFSGIVDDTNTIVFESAMFSGPSIRVTAKKLGLRTEASARYEKGLDAQLTVAALDRACELVEQLGAGEVCRGYIDVNRSDYRPTRISLDPDWINAFLGTGIPADFMKKALRSLDFGVDDDGIITVPSYRADVSHKADVAEEIGRIYGYNKIPVTLMRGATTRGGLSPEQKFEKKVNSTLQALGLTEITTYSFISPKYYDNIRMAADSPLRRSVRIANPLGEDTGIMRTTLLPSMMEVLRGNYHNRNMEAQLYELGTVYLPRGAEELPDERQQIAVGMYGEKVDYYTLKGAVEELLDAVGIDDYDVKACADDPSFHPGRCATILIGGEPCAVLGEIHPQVQANYGMDVRVYAALIDFSALFRGTRGDRQYRPLPRFPATTRDIAVTCGEDMPVLEIEKLIRTAAGDVLEAIELFDVYRGKQVPAGKKSAAFRIRMRAADRTLTDDEADAVMSRIVGLLGQKEIYLRA